MKEVIQHLPEYLPYVGVAVGMLGMAFSSAQREWIKERDQQQCQFPVSHTATSYQPCGSNRRLQVHHVEPQRWSKDVLHKPSSEIDVPENGITLCEEHHQNCVHGPDMPLAHANYFRDKNSYKKTFLHRNEQVTHHQKYWNDSWDHLFKRIVIARNNLMTREFPRK